MNFCDSCEHKGRMQYCTKCVSHDGAPSEYARASLSDPIKTTQKTKGAKEMVESLYYVLGCIDTASALLPSEKAISAFKLCNAELKKIIDRLNSPAEEKLN